jgi:uncharacterized protein YegJ (DUF2314 family)
MIAGPAAAQDTSPSFDFGPDDQEMLSAIEEARTSLSYFFGAASSEGVTGQALKVAVTTDDGTVELLWMDACRPSETEDLACLIANQPSIAKLNKGDLYHLKLDAVADWMFTGSDGLIHGAYTARAMIPRLSEREAASFSARLAPLPAPN